MPSPSLALLETLFVLSLAASLLSSSGLSSLHPDIITLPLTPDIITLVQHALNNRIRLEGGANVLAAAQAAGVRRYLRQSVAFWAIPGPGLADEDTPLAFSAAPAVAAGAREVTELEHRLLGNSNIEGIALRYGFFYGPGTWFNPDG